MNNQTKNQKRWAGAGILTAFTASLCCITPVLTVVAGVSGIAMTFSWLEALRPVFIAATVLVLGFAWYLQLRPRKKIDCDCEDETKVAFMQTKKFLGIVSVVAALLLTFPYYAGSFFTMDGRTAETVKPDNIQMIRLNIEGMTCSGCEVNINQTVSQIDGVLEVASNHRAGTATVRFDRSRTTKEKIVETIDQTGYRVVAEKTISNEF